MFHLSHIGGFALRLGQWYNPIHMKTSTNLTAWNSLHSIQRGHLLQSPAWGALKNRFGWTPRQVLSGEAGAQILFKHLPLGKTIAYIPKGPLVDWHDAPQCRELFSAIDAEAKKHNAIFLKIEPDVWRQSTETAAAVTDFMSNAGFIQADTIQPQTTILVDISGDEETILADMKQKTRYNIRLAKRKGVSIRRGNETDIQIFYDLSQQTAPREEFGIHSLDYYQAAHRLFGSQQCALLVAEYQGEPLAALMAFCQDQHAYYFYGASSNTHRNLMATYLIQWEAIRWAKGRGCNYYDLWGVPNADVDTLEAEFTDRSDGLWGVYRFKRGFGGEVVKSVGAYDYVYSPLLYRLYKLYRYRF